MEAVVAGVAAGCRENGCALIGGETAEMPGIYTPPDYDLAGFIVGYVEEDAHPRRRARSRRATCWSALASIGLHTNGYSLARRIVAERMQPRSDDPFPGEDGSVADVLLRIHRRISPRCSRCSMAQDLMRWRTSPAAAFPGNLNRALPDTLDAVVDDGELGGAERLPRSSSARGEVPRDEMFRTFNMGVGMVVDHRRAGPTRRGERRRGWRERLAARAGVRGSGQVTTQLRR